MSTVKIFKLAQQFENKLEQVRSRMEEEKRLLTTLVGWGNFLDSHLKNLGIASSVQKIKDELDYATNNGYSLPGSLNRVKSALLTILNAVSQVPSNTLLNVNGSQLTISQIVQYLKDYLLKLTSLSTKI